MILQAVPKFKAKSIILLRPEIIMFILYFSRADLLLNRNLKRSFKKVRS